MRAVPYVYFHIPENHKMYDMLSKNSRGLLKRAWPSKVESEVLLSSRKSKGSARG